MMKLFFIFSGTGGEQEEREDIFDGIRLIDFVFCIDEVGIKVRLCFCAVNTSTQT